MLKQRRQNDVVSMLMQGHDLALMLIQSYFKVGCLLGYDICIYISSECMILGCSDNEIEMESIVGSLAPEDIRFISENLDS